MERRRNSNPDEQSGKTPLVQVIQDRLNAHNIHPHEALGQHFLVDEDAISLLADSVTPGNTVIEVGAGVGQLTEALAEKATSVTAVEIDRRYEPILSEIAQRNPNITIIYGNILSKKFKDLVPPQNDDRSVQIVANLPFHITEPFLEKATRFPVEDITLMVGQKLVDEILAKNESSANFGKLTLLTQAYFDIDVLRVVEKEHFMPPPRTESAIIRLTPKDASVQAGSLREFVFRRLFDAHKESAGVRSILKDAITEYAYANEEKSKKRQKRKARRDVKMDLKHLANEYTALPPGAFALSSKSTSLRPSRIPTSVSSLGLPDSLLTQPVNRLSNQQLRELSQALRLVDQRGQTVFNRRDQ